MNLIRDGGQALPNMGILSLQKRQDVLAHPIPGKAAGGVRAVDAEFEAVKAQIVQNFGFLEFQKRPDEPHARRQGTFGKNPGQGLQAAAAQQAQKNAFGLIVQMVRGRGLAAAQALSLAGQGLIAQLTPRFLKPKPAPRGGLGHGDRDDARRHAPLFAQAQNEARVGVGGAPAQAVVEMDEEQREAAAAALRPEIVPQADGIRPSGNRGENTAAGNKKTALLFKASHLRPNARREGFFSHARIVSNCLLGLFLALGPLAAGTAFASGVAKSTSTAAKPRASVAKSSAAAAGAAVAVSTSAARAAAYARTAQAEFGRHEYWSAWRDAGNAIHFGSNGPAVAALRAQAYDRAMAEEKVAVSSVAAKAALRPHPVLPEEKQAPEQIPSAPKAPVVSKRNIWRRAAAALVLGLLILAFLIVLISRPPSPAKPRRDPGQGHVSASEVPKPAPLPKAGAVLGGRFILGSMKEEADGVCVYDGRDLNDESITIVRYPSVPGGLERARKAVDFKHPSVAHLHGAFSQGVCIFAAYEPLRGDSLRKTLERLPERRYSPEQALRLMKHLCEALDAAHALGLCHGPLAPGEIIIGPSQVKMRGFGLWPVAALAYAAPEFSPGNGESTPSSDIFSLAACLYEMLTGKTAFFESRDPQGTALFAPPSQKVPELGPAMDEFFAKALAPEPEGRFASASEFFTAFSRLVVSKAAPGKDGKKT